MTLARWQCGLVLLAVCGYHGRKADAFATGSFRRISHVPEQAQHQHQHQHSEVAGSLPPLQATTTFNRPTCRPRQKSYLKADVLADGSPLAAGTDSSSRGQGERGEDQFERWAAKVGIKAPKLRHEVFRDAVVGELRGLKAVEATSMSEALATVPAKVVISLIASESTPFQSWVSSDFWDSQQWYVKLALKLLWERQLGAASEVEGYLNVLPAQGSFDTLIHWTDEELDLLHYPRCAASAKRQRAAWDKVHQSLFERCPEGAGRAVTRDDLVWAMECVLSRAFNGRFGGGQNSVILCGGLAIAAGAVYAATEQPIWVLLAALALLPLTLPELGSLGTALSGERRSVQDYVLVPFVDSMNHVTTATTELSFSPVSGSLSVSVNRGYREGDQAYISYGLKSNDELLQFYGFVEADCPADTYVMGDILTKLGMPEERLRAIKDAGVRAALSDGIVIRRGPQVVSEEALEGLRSLLQTDDGAVRRELRSLCETDLAFVRPSEDEPGGVEGSVRERLAHAFRIQKSSVLKEAIRNLKA